MYTLTRYDDTDEILARYTLVGGPVELAARIERVAAACRDDKSLAEMAERQAEALFVAIPGANIASWPMPEWLGDDAGAFNMMVALAALPFIAKTQAEFGFPRAHLAHTLTWMRPMIRLYAKCHGGVPGITHTRMFWLRHHIDGRLFRFGNMEFLRGDLPGFLPDDFKMSLGADDEVPTFHFPGGEGGLDVSTMKRSFAEATEFWREKFGHYPKAWACDSWLFNPDWKDLIPDSRIAHAVDIFERLPSPGSGPSGIYFVYGVEEGDPRNFPVNTSLERAFVKIYESGRMPVSGRVWVKVSEAGEVLWKS